MKTVIYSKYSNERNHRLAIRTDILEDERGKRYVQKVSEFPEGQMHIASLYHWYQTFSKMCEGTRLFYNRCEIIPGGVELEYLTGRSLEEHLLDVAKEEGIDQCAGELIQYLEFIKEIHRGAKFEPTVGFRKVFGDVKLPLGTECAPCSNIDLVCGNILIEGGNWTAIDYEWSFDFPIPVNYLLYRIIFYFADHANRGEEFRRFRLMERMGITEEERKAFEDMETNFQHYVCHHHIPIRDMYQDISRGVLRVEEYLEGEAFQIYFDQGEGYSEENSTTMDLYDGKVELELKLPEGLKALRIDPCRGAGMVELIRFRFDNEDKRAGFSLREGAVVGNWLYLGDRDPNILIDEIPEGAKTLQVHMHVYPMEEVPMEEMGRLAKEFVKQKQLLKEMQGTKVWKLYQGYRSRRDKKES